MTVPEGHLPVFSVNSAEEAKILITLTCPTNEHGEYYARELAEVQTLDNLDAFSDKLAAAYELMKQKGMASE